MTEPITLEPMQPIYHRQVGRLLAHLLHGKFRNLTYMDGDELALFFERWLEHVPDVPGNRRMVALQEGKVIGTIAIKWPSQSCGSVSKPQRTPPTWQSFRGFGRWNLFKMRMGLSLFDYKPQVGECYIADVAVHPDYRGQGVGKLLLRWAEQFAQQEPGVDRLSLYVSGKNQRARKLYEQLGYSVRSHEKSLLWHWLFNEKEWGYMWRRLE